MQEGDENWHEVGDGRCRENDIIGFGIVRAQCTKLRAKRTHWALQSFTLSLQCLQSSLLCALHKQFCALRARSQNRWCHFVGKAHLLLHANFHRPPALLATTFRLKQDKLIRYPSHPFWTAILFFLMALMRVIRKFDVSKMFFIHAWYPLYFSFCSSFSKNGQNYGSKGQFWTKS